VAAGIAIDRFALNQHLLREAVEAGAELHDSTVVTTPVVEDGAVVGVRWRRRKGDEVGETRAPVTVDATGWRGVLRRAVPPGWPIAEVVPKEETAIAYREERRRREPVQDMLVEATFDFERAPQGIYWYADRSPTLVNVGIGMQRVEGVPNPRRTIRQAVLPLYNGLEDTEVIRAGAGVIPNRRAIDCPVADGLLALGDAACQVNPISGSGIGASMHAAIIAAGVITNALESSASPSAEDLLPYATSYQRGYGRDQAAFQVARETLQAMTNAQLNRLMGTDTLSEDDLNSAVRTGKLTLSFGAKLKAAGKLIGEPGLIRALLRMQRRMEAVRDHYSAYPGSLRGLEAWRRGATKLFR
jgi:digeranylgeranylglycerophospholipid reductase